MSDKRWKRSERDIANVLGGQRVPVTGRSRGSAPDVAHPWLAIECKSRQSVPEWIKEAMVQAEASVRGNQLPVAIVHEVGNWHVNDIVMVRLGDFIDWFGKERNLGDGTDKAAGSQATNTTTDTTEGDRRATNRRNAGRIRLSRPPVRVQPKLCDHARRV